MKKRLFLGLAALAAVTFTSCQKDQVINQVEEKQAIEFGTYVGRDAMTKAASIDNATDLQSHGFGVFAYYTNDSDFNNSTSTPNFMYNQNVTWNSTDSKWEYTPVKYWPNEETNKLSFFAYAPYDNNVSGTDNAAIELSTNTATGTPVLTYKVDNDVANHEDILWAEPIMNQTKPNTGDNISFNFKHALSRIGFKVQSIIDITNSNNGEDGSVDTGTDASGDKGSETTIRIQSVSLSGYFYSQGNLTYTLGDHDNDNSTADTYAPSFTARKAADKTFTLKNDNNITNGNTEYGNFLAVSDNVTTAISPLNNENSYLMIMPQDFTQSSNNKLKLNIVYTVTTSDNNLNGGSSVITNNITKEFYVASSFDAGKAYNLCLHIGLTSVKVTAEVTEWADGSDYVVNVPNNTPAVTPAP